MPKHVAAEQLDTEWRRLSQFLWVGADSLGPIGVVEHGWRYKALDTDGTLAARCRNLDEAKALLEHLARLRRAVQTSAPRSAA
jgi:hypothetical protein